MNLCIVDATWKISCFFSQDNYWFSVVMKYNPIDLKVLWFFSRQLQYHKSLQNTLQSCRMNSIQAANTSLQSKVLKNECTNPILTSLIVPKIIKCNKCQAKNTFNCPFKKYLYLYVWTNVLRCFKYKKYISQNQMVISSNVPWTWSIIFTTSTSHQTQAPHCSMMMCKLCKIVFGMEISSDFLAQRQIL